jgi:hypothetical protein
MTLTEVARLDIGADAAAADYIKLLSPEERRSELLRLVAEEIRGIRRADAAKAERAADIEDRREEGRRKYANKKQRDSDVAAALAEGYGSLYAKRNAAVVQSIRDWELSIRLDTTRELLATTFALPDGREVTWGRATVRDHEQRRDMLINQGVGTLVTAYRHELAIQAITASGMATLNGVRAMQVEP